MSVVIAGEVISGKVKHRETQAEKNGQRTTLGTAVKGMLESKYEPSSALFHKVAGSVGVTCMNACQAADTGW